jgi:hypothetical protein
MTYVPIDYSNYRVSPQIIAFVLTNLIKLKYNTLYFNTNFRSRNVLFRPGEYSYFKLILMFKRYACIDACINVIYIIIV